MNLSGIAALYILSDSLARLHVNGYGLLDCEVTKLILKGFNYKVLFLNFPKGYIWLSGDYSRMPADERAYFTPTMVLARN